MSVRPKSVLAVLLPALLALAVGACGGDAEQPTGADLTATDVTITEARADDGVAATPEDDAKQVAAAAQAVIVDPDNAYVCAEVITEQLLETSYGDLSGCENGRRPVTLAESAKVSKIEIKGQRASAEALPKGGLYDGETLAVVAVRDGAGWRIDRLTADIPVGP